MHYFPAKLISIIPAGSDRIKIYSRILPELLPTNAKDQSSKADRKIIDFKQDDLAEITQSIITEVSNNLFDVDSVDGILRAKIEKSAGRIIAKVQKYV